MHALCYSRHMHHRFTALALSAALMIPSITFAHPGALDANGCHTCKTNCTEKYALQYGQYHCHKGSDRTINYTPAQAGGAASSVASKKAVKSASKSSKKAVKKASKSSKKAVKAASKLSKKSVNAASRSSKKSNSLSLQSSK